MVARKAAFIQILTRKESLLFLVLFLAGISLLGWILGKIDLASFSLIYRPIAPSAAIVFIILCTLFLVDTHFRNSRFAQSLLIPSVLFVSLICLEIFLEHVFNFPWDIENFYARNLGLMGSLPIGHMSPISAMSFISVCIGILGIRQNNSDIIKYVGGRFSLAVFIVSSVLLIGYLYNSPLLYGSKIIPVALPAAICFFLFSITLLRIYEVQFWTFNLIKSNSISRQLLKWFLPIVIFIVILQGLLITNISIHISNPVLSASLILLIVLFLTVIVVIRVSSIIGIRILNSEKELTNSEEKYRNLIENIGEGVGYLNDEETFTYGNPSAEKIFGVGKGELSGLCLSNFLSRETIEIIKNETQKRRQGESSRYELEIVLKDRSKKVILVTATPRFEDEKFIGTFGIFRDITDQKRIEERILLFANAIRSVSECISITDRADNILFVNSAFLKTYQYEEHELLGNNISIVGSPKNPPSVVKEILPSTLKGGWQGEILNLRKDGSEFPVYISTSVIFNENNIPIALIGVTNDISKRKRTEEEIR
jgi:PAS domain S-box-containing protein